MLQRKLREINWTQYRLRAELIARGEKVPTGLICRWVDGSRVPDLTRALLLQDLLELDVRLWARPSARKAA